MNISSLVEVVLRKFGTEIPDIRTISENLELRLFDVDDSLPLKEAKKHFLKNYLNEMLILSRGNVSEAARKAHMHRRHLHRMMNEMEMDADSYRLNMVKPKQYMKEHVQSALEDSLPEAPIDDISEVIVQNMDPQTYEEALDHFEREYIEKLLQKCQYDLSKASEHMQISERTLYRKINKLGIAVA